MLNRDSVKALENKVAEIQLWHEQTALKQKKAYDIVRKAGNRVKCKKMYISPGEVDVSDEVRVFYEEHYGKLFESSVSNVVLAMYHLNRNFVLRGTCVLNEFYEFLGLEPIEGGLIGWDVYTGFENYGYQWIDFYFNKLTTDDGLEVYEIVFAFEPTEDCTLENVYR